MYIYFKKFQNFRGPCPPPLPQQRPNTYLCPYSKPYNFIVVFGNKVVSVAVGIFLVNILLRTLFLLIMSIETFVTFCNYVLWVSFWTNHYFAIYISEYIYIYIYICIFEDFFFWCPDWFLGVSCKENQAQLSTPIYRNLDPRAQKMHQHHS